MILQSDIVRDLFRMLDWLELPDDKGTKREVGFFVDYTVRYGGRNVLAWNSNVEDEELEPTDEEADIIYICDNGVDAWLKKIDDTLLGVDDGNA